MMSRMAPPNIPRRSPPCEYLQHRHATLMWRSSCQKRVEEKWTAAVSASEETPECIHVPVQGVTQMAQGIGCADEPSTADTVTVLARLAKSIKTKLLRFFFEVVRQLSIWGYLPKRAPAQRILPYWREEMLNTDHYAHRCGYKSSTKCGVQQTLTTNHKHQWCNFFIKDTWQVKQANLGAHILHTVTNTQSTRQKMKCDQCGMWEISLSRSLKEFSTLTGVLCHVANKLLRGNQILGCFKRLPDHLLIPISLKMCELETLSNCNAIGSEDSLSEISR